MNGFPWQKSGRRGCLCPDFRYGSGKDRRPNAAGLPGRFPAAAAGRKGSKGSLVLGQNVLALVAQLTSSDFSYSGLTGKDMTWNAEGQVSKAPTAYVIKDGEYVLPED